MFYATRPDWNRAPSCLLWTTVYDATRPSRYKLNQRWFWLMSSVPIDNQIVSCGVAGHRSQICVLQLSHHSIGIRTISQLYSYVGRMITCHRTSDIEFALITYLLLFRCVTWIFLRVDWLYFVTIALYDFASVLPSWVIAMTFHDV